MGLAAIAGAAAYFAWLYYTTPLATVRLDIQATQLSFDVNPQQVAGLLGALDTPTLYLSHFEKIDLGPGQLLLPSGERSSSNVIEANPGEDATAQFSPAALSRVVPADQPVRVLISWEEADPRVLRLALSSIESVRLNPPVNSIDLACSSCQGVAKASDLMLLSFTPERNAHEPELIPRDGSLRLGLQLAEPERFRIDNVPVAAHLDFHRSGEIRPMSSIQSGTVYFTDDGSELKIGSPLIQLRGLSNFRISDVRLKTEDRQPVGLQVRAIGGVQDFIVDGKGGVLPGVIERRFGTDRFLIVLTLIVTAIGAAATALGVWDAISSKLNGRKGKSK